MPRPRTGSTYWDGDRLYARITWVDPNTGKQRARSRRVPENKTSEVPRIVRELENSLESGGTELVDGAKMTFRQVAEAFAAEHFKPAKIIKGRKVEGLRELRMPTLFLKTLVAHFGHKKIQSVTYKDLAQFKNLRMKTPTIRGDDRAPALVNRELQILRQVLRFAHNQGWIHRNPWVMGQPLINQADEAERIRVLTFAEEAALLAQCKEPRQHLRSLIIVGIDTFVRLSELRRLRKSDINFKDRCIVLKSENTKTFRERRIGLTPRALDELDVLCRYLKDDDLLFNYGSSKRSWATACRLAGVKDAQMADLRDTGITRRLEAVVRANLPWHTVMKESGHTQFKTFMRYFNPSLGLQLAGAEAMGNLEEMQKAGAVSPPTMATDIMAFADSSD